MILYFERSIYLDYSQGFVKNSSLFFIKSNKKESWIYTMAFCSDYVDRVSGSGCRHTKVIEVVTDHSLVSKLLLFLQSVSKMRSSIIVCIWEHMTIKNKILLKQKDK